MKIHTTIWALTNLFQDDYKFTIRRSGGLMQGGLRMSYIEWFVLLSGEDGTIWLWGPSCRFGSGYYKTLLFPSQTMDLSDIDVLELRKEIYLH